MQICTGELLLDFSPGLAQPQILPRHLPSVQVKEMLWLKVRKLPHPNRSAGCKPARISPCLMYGIRKPGRSLTLMREAPFECRSTVSNNCCRESPRANPLSPIALDPAKAQAPVWRENFSSGDTIRFGRSSADSTPGRTLAFQWRRNRKRLLRSTSVAKQRPRSLAAVRLRLRRRVRVQSLPLPACLLRTTVQSESLREARAAAVKTLAADDQDRAPSRSVPPKLL